MAGLVFWTVLGALLRFTNLSQKPLWTDEFSTLVFSLGNSFRTLPLNQPLSIATLLQPLHPNPQAGIIDVLHHLLTESNHPPLYFVLTHLWLKLFPVAAIPSPQLLWGARSLAALLGVLAIPALYALARLTVRDTAIAQLAAALMALSPFAIYLSQEARHYTLPILWIIASLACLVSALQRVRDRQPLPLWLCLAWIGVNGLGMATHYFMLFTLAAEAGIVLIEGGRQVQQGKASRVFWQRIGLVGLGTLLIVLPWVPLLQGIQGTELTQWVYRGGDRSGWAGLEPIGQLMGGWITMLYLLPIQAADSRIVTASVILLVLFTLGTIPILFHGLRRYARLAASPDSLRVLAGFVLGAIALLLGLTYLAGMDLTSAFRYNFIYFPAVMLLIAVGLAANRPAPARFLPRLRVRPLILALSFLGALTVLTNLGYQKTHRPDLVTAAIREASRHPALVAIAHQTHGQTGRLMALAWEMAQDPTLPTTQFLLAHQGTDDREPIRALRRSLRQLPRPLDLWLINVQSVPEKPLQTLLSQQRCESDGDADAVDGYQYQLYRCQ